MPLRNSLFRIALIATLWAAPLHAADQGTVKLSGKVTGASGKHAIYIALWGEASFLRHPVQQIRIEPGASPQFTFSVPSGRWALSAYEDMNDNKKLDIGMFGPKEPSGFYRAFHAWRKPRFNDVASDIKTDNANADIALH